MCSNRFRHITATTLNRVGFAANVIEIQVARSDKNTARAAYKYVQPLAQRSRMMQAWADMVAAARDSATVIPGRFSEAA